MAVLSSKANEDMLPLMTDNFDVDENKTHWNKTRFYKKILLIAGCILVLISSYFVIAYLLEIFPFEQSSKTTFKAGLYGKWAIYGGNIQQQQTAPNPQNIVITQNNVQQLSTECTYTSINGTAFAGYPTIDNDNKAYFSDMSSGYITSIDLDNNCTEHWRSHVGELLGYNKSITVNVYHTLTIFQDNKGTKGLLFGAPTRNRVNNDLIEIMNDYSCYAVAVYLNNGSFWWKVALGNGTKYKNDYLCAINGFIIEENYAYGGMTKGNDYYVDSKSQYIGRYFKIDINKHEIIHQWYPITDLNKTNFDEYNRSYRGMSVYGLSGAIIDEYLIFGTSNLHDVPSYIDQCVEYSLNHSTVYNPYLSFEQSVSQDICGNNQSNNTLWRCLEKGVYVDSLIILNKHSFETLKAIPLQGLDISAGGGCVTSENPDFYCPKHKQTILNTDLVAVAAYKNVNDGKKYVAASQKSGRFHIFDVETGKLIISKRFGPHTTSAIFPLGVDESSMIAVTVINGAGVFGTYPIRYNLLNNMTVCGNTGTILAFNLTTGTTIWQQVHPFGLINDDICFNESIPWNYDSTSATTCETGPFLNINEKLTVKNVDILQVTNNTIKPINIENRAKFNAPLTIVKDMVFVPSDSGDVWVIDLYDGSFLHHFNCPNKYDTNYIAWNRPGIHGGITVVEDRIVFYCGTYTHNPLDIVGGNIFVSMKLKK